MAARVLREVNVSLGRNLEKYEAIGWAIERSFVVDLGPCFQSAVSLSFFVILCRACIGRCRAFASFVCAIDRKGTAFIRIYATRTNERTSDRLTCSSVACSIHT